MYWANLFSFSNGLSMNVEAVVDCFNLTFYVRRTTVINGAFLSCISSSSHFRTVCGRADILY